MTNHQLEVIEQAIKRLEALKKRTAPQTAIAGVRGQARDYSDHREVTYDAHLIVAMMMVDLVHTTLDCVDLAISDTHEKGFLSTELVDDALAEGDELADEYSTASSRIFNPNRVGGRS